MNANCFKTVFNQRLLAVVAVGEHACAQGKSASGEGVRSAVLAAAILFGSLNSAFALDANALPSAHQVASGQVQVTSSGARMDIQQSSNKAILNWQSFNVGSGAKVHIQQPSSSAALLNRVVGNNPSQIHGQIHANGQVVLVNPNGVLVGSSGSITASAFTASTFGISDADFESGNLRITRNGSSASVVNQGSIQTHGGYVALIGATVSNSGSISTGGGNALLGAGDAVSIPLAGNIRLELDPAAFASVDNSGTITTDGGQVFMRASAVVDAVSNVANATVTHSGTIHTAGGRVDVLADHGSVRVSGAINAGGASVFIGRDEKTNVLAAVGDASGAQLESQGGFVETSGAYLVTTGTRVKAAEWLLDPTNITIQAANPSGDTYAVNQADFSPTQTSVILASTIKASLDAGTSVTLQTTGVAGDSLGTGNIAVNESISKTGGGEATLTLKAHNNITVAANKSISSNSGKLNVVFHSDSDGNGEGGILMNGGSSMVSNGGNITFGGGATGSSTNSEYAQSVGGIGVNLSGTTINAGAGKFTAKGKSGTAQGVLFSGANNITAAQYTIDGQSTNGAAVYMGNGTTTFTSTGNGLASSIKGTSQTGRGVFIQVGTLNFNANSGSNTTFSSGKGEMRLGFGGGVTVNTNGNVTLGSDQTGFFSQAQTTVENGTLTIKGKSAGHGVAIQDGSGFATNILVKNGSSLVVDGESTGSGSGIHLLPAGVANKIEMSGVNSAGQRGTINMTGVSAAGVGISTSVTPITSDGGNITLNGTSGGPNGTGLLLQGLIRSGDNASGGIVTLNGTANGTGSSVGIFSMGTIQGGTVNMTGLAKGTNNAIFSASSGSITATTGGVGIKGTNTSTAANGGGGTTLHGTVKAKSTVNLEGYSAGGMTQGLVILNAVESTTGDIIVTGETKSATQRAVAINALTGSVFGGLKVADGKNITINANTLLLAGATKVVDAGASGTVNIKARNGNEIVIGGSVTNDVMAAALADQKLGIDQTELNRITAGNLVIGDTASTGKITVAAAATTADTTGNITLQTQGDIDFAASLTTGHTGTKTLSLKSDGAIGGSASGVITTKELAIGSASFSSNPNVALSAATHQISQVYGDAQAFALKNGRALIVGATSSTQGLIANGNVTIESASTGSGAGILVKEFINNNSGNVSLTGTSTTGNGVHIAKDVQTQNGRVTITGTSSASASGVLLQKANTNDSLNIAATQGIVIEGSSASGTGVDLDGGTFNQTGNHDFGTGNAIHIKGSTGTDSAAVAGVRLNNEIFNWNNTSGKIVIEATKGALVSNNVAKITQNANANVELSTDNLGDLTAAQINKQSTGAGDIILAAGKTRLAGDGDGGQVKGVAGNTITNNGSGKLLVYSGNAAGTDNLSSLDSTLGALKVDGTVTQNADTNAALGAGTGISGSLAKAQAIFRQKLNFADGTLTDASLTKTYGDTSTANTGAAAAMLLGEAKEALKTAAGVNSTVTVGNGINNIVVSKSAIVDTLTDTLSGGAFSTSGFLKANTGTYKFEGMSSTKYGVGTGIDVTVNVNPLVLTGSIAQGQTTYGSALVTGTVSLTNKVGSDVVSANGVTINTTGNTSTSGHLKASDTAYVGIQSISALTGDDAANYTFADVKGDYVVDKLTLTGSIAQGQTTYGSALVTGTVSLTNKVDSDVVSANGVTINTTGNTSTSAHLKAGTHTALQSLSGLTGDDAANYTFADIKGDYKVDKLAITLSGITAEHKVYDGNNSATISTSGAVFSGMVTGDVLAVASTGTFYDKNAGTAKTVSLSNTLSGTDLGNYSITQQASTTADITKKDVTLESLTASNKTYDGNTNATITAGTISGTVGTETLAISGSGTFDTKNAGTNKTVTVSDVTSLSKANGDNGGDWSNYNLTTIGQKTTTADVTQKVITLSGITAEHKVYDGNTTATVSTHAAVFSGMVTGDVLAVASTGTFSDKNAGTAKTVTLSNTLSGDDLGNYSITEQASTTANITPRPASVSATATQLTYNGATQIQNAPTNSGLLEGDELTTGGVAAGSAVGVYASNLQVTGADAGNYAFTITNNNLVIEAPKEKPTEVQVASVKPVIINSTDIDRGTVTLTSNLDRAFELSNFETPRCERDDLTLCTCEEALNEQKMNAEDLYICFDHEENTMVH